MPDGNARWVWDAETIVDQLAETGMDITIEVMYANNSVETQYASVEHFIAEEVDCLVIACVDPYSLTDLLEEAEAAGIPVIAYDRLPMNTDAVSYYTTFDNRAVGVLQGEYIVDAVLASNDSTAMGVTNALTAFGMSDYVLTGQDCDLEAVRNIVSGTQSMSVFKDSGIMARHTAQMVLDIVSGQEPEINDTATYSIPSYLCLPTVVTADNYEELLIDSGYYTKAEILG